MTSSLRVRRDAYDAVLFDLDGVLTPTAALHARCWKRTFDDVLARHTRQSGEQQAPFDADREYLAHVDGKSRSDGVHDFLRARGVLMPEGEVADGPDVWSVHGIGNRKQALVERELGAGSIDPFHAGGFGLVVGVARAAGHAELRAAGADLVVDDLEDLAA
jgi:beta-phosphoglucomutase-like phosphatase (HAD superfamily)